MKSPLILDYAPLLLMCALFIMLYILCFFLGESIIAFYICSVLCLIISIITYSQEY